MGKSKKIISCCLVAILTSCVFARQLSFQIVQHDLSSDDVTEQSLSIEDELINSFFEKGYIVTNSPAVSSKSQSQDEKFFKLGIGEAFEGYSDYFVQVKIFYAPRTGTLTGNGNIEKIEWSISNAKTGIIISDQKLENIKPIVKATDTRSVALQLVTDINKALNSNKA